MDNLCYHIFNRHLPNVSFYKNNLNKKIVSYLTRTLEIERIDEHDFVLEMKKYLEDLCIQLFHHFKNQLSKEELITYMRNLVEYQNSHSTIDANKTSRKTKDAVVRLMDFAFRNKDIKDAIESIIRNIKDNNELKKKLISENKEKNKKRRQAINEFYYKNNGLENSANINDDNLLYKIKQIAEDKNKIENKKISKKLLNNSLANIDFNNELKTIY